MNQEAILLSVVTPAYNEARNLGILYQQLCTVMDQLQVQWEWVVVDDHSTDETFAIISNLAEKDRRVRGFRFSRNFGSHIALTCGLHHARGDCVALMAADLQDPPDMLPSLFARWQEGIQVVWAVRSHREGEKARTRGFSRLYYLIMRNLVGLKEIPSTGADFALLDRRVVDAFCKFGETNTSILALITWMGFRQASITYDKQARLHGKSGWNLGKKVKLVIDSIISFSYFPIRLMSYLGLIFSLLGLLYASFIVIHALTGTPPLGWSSLIVVVLIIGGIQMLMIGVLGEYLWRTLDEARHRPRYIIEALVNAEPITDQQAGEK